MTLNARTAHTKKTVLQIVMGAPIQVICIEMIRFISLCHFIVSVFQFICQV